MSPHLFTALTTQSQLLPDSSRYRPAEAIQTWDSVILAIVLTNNAFDAQKRFEAHLQTQTEGESPRLTIIHRISSVKLVDKVLTENSEETPAWSDINEQLRQQTESVPVDDFEQGYWVDVGLVIRPTPLALSIEALRQGLPEDIRGDLNWSADRQFFYLLTALSLPTPPADLTADARLHTSPHPLEETEDNTEEAAARLSQFLITFPQAADKAAALVCARNSTVAAWLWYRHIAKSTLTANPIRIDPLCQIVDLQ